MVCLLRYVSLMSNPQVPVTYFSIISRSYLPCHGRTAAAKVKMGDVLGGFQGSYTRRRMLRRSYNIFCISRAAAENYKPQIGSATAVRVSSCFRLYHSTNRVGKVV